METLSLIASEVRGVNSAGKAAVLAAPHVLVESEIVGASEMDPVSVAVGRFQIALALGLVQMSGIAGALVVGV